MSENELNNEEKLENAIPDNDYTMEVKQGFFSKLFNREPKKALPDPNRKVKTTGLSIDFIWKMRTLRADAMEWMENRMDDLKNTSGAKFFDPAQQSVFPERDFHLSLRADTVPFILRLKKEGDSSVMERVDVL